MVYMSRGVPRPPLWFVALFTAPGLHHQHHTQASVRKISCPAFLRPVHLHHLTMNSKILLVSSLAAAAVALLPPCLPGLGAEFCPSSAPTASHDRFKSLHEAVRYPNLTQQNELEEIFSRLNKSRMEDDLVRLLRLPNRSANSSQGKLAQELIRDAAENSRWVDLSDGDRDSPYYPPGISKSYTPQYNIHLETLGGQNDFDDDFTSANQIIVGAHMDSINQGSSSDPEAMIAPGADDNGSGVVVLLEVVRVVAATFFKKPPRNPIAFHWCVLLQRPSTCRQMYSADIQPKGMREKN